MSLVISAFLSPPAKVLRSIAGVDPQSLQKRNLYKRVSRKCVFILLFFNYDNLLIIGKEKVISFFGACQRDILEQRFQ